MISVNRNFGSLVGQPSLKTANNAVETAVERLSSGARAHSAADDTFGITVVSKIGGQIEILRFLPIPREAITWVVSGLISKIQLDNYFL